MNSFSERLSRLGFIYYFSVLLLDFEFAPAAHKYVTFLTHTAVLDVYYSLVSSKLLRKRLVTL